MDIPYTGKRAVHEKSANMCLSMYMSLWIIMCAVNLEWKVRYERDDRIGWNREQHSYKCIDNEESRLFHFRWVSEWEYILDPSICECYNRENCDPSYGSLNERRYTVADIFLVDNHGEIRRRSHYYTFSENRFDYTEEYRYENYTDMSHATSWIIEYEKSAMKSATILIVMIWRERFIFPSSRPEKV